MKKSERSIGDLISVITIAILFLVILLLVVFSAVSYQRAVDIQNGNDNSRALLSYVVTAVRNGGTGRAALEERGGIPVLVLLDEDTGYEQQIFHTGGKVYEAYGKAGTQPDPEDALLIAETERFEMSWLREDLLEIRTDAGGSCVHIPGREEDR